MCSKCSEHHHRDRHERREECQGRMYIAFPMGPMRNPDPDPDPCFMTPGGMVCTSPGAGGSTCPMTPGCPSCQAPGGSCFMTPNGPMCPRPRMY
jgi:hypothetical protein